MTIHIGMRRDTIWTRAMMERLTELWDAGTRALAIARIMSGEYSVSLSKNAIIGKTHRLMLKPRLTQMNEAAAKANRAAAQARTIGKLGCRWVYRLGAGSKPTVFCAQPTLEGKSYCAEHHTRVYMPVAQAETLRSGKRT